MLRTVNTYMHTLRKHVQVHIEMYGLTHTDTHSECKRMYSTHTYTYTHNHKHVQVHTEMHPLTDTSIQADSQITGA